MRRATVRPWMDIADTPLTLKHRRIGLEAERSGHHKGSHFIDTRVASEVRYR